MLVDTFLLLVILTQGIVIGVVGLDMYVRWQDRKERLAHKAELTTTLATLAEMHNKNAKTMQDIQDRVGRHDMVLNARAAR